MSAVSDGITYLGRKLSEEYDAAVSYTGDLLHKGAHAIGISEDTLVNNPLIKAAAHIGDEIENAVHKVLPCSGSHQIRAGYKNRKFSMADARVYFAKICFACAS